MVGSSTQMNFGITVWRKIQQKWKANTQCENREEMKKILKEKRSGQEYTEG